MSSHIIPILLARHGETFWNTQQRLQGHLDSHLTAIGHKQAKLLAQKFADHKVTTVISSTLPRALNTAKVYVKNNAMSLISDARLKERHFGTWQGQTMASLQKNTQYHEVFYQLNLTAPPEGESSIAAAKRFHLGLSQQIMTLVNNTQNARTPIGVVSHGEVLRCFLASIDSHRQSANKNASELFVNGGVTALNFNQETQEFSLC